MYLLCTIKNFSKWKQLRNCVTKWATELGQACKLAERSIEMSWRLLKLRKLSVGESGAPMVQLLHDAHSCKLETSLGSPIHAWHGMYSCIRVCENYCTANWTAWSLPSHCPAFSMIQAPVYPQPSTNFNTVLNLRKPLSIHKTTLYLIVLRCSPSKTVINRETSLEGAFGFIADLAMFIPTDQFTYSQKHKLRPVKSELLLPQFGTAFSNCENDFPRNAAISDCLVTKAKEGLQSAEDLKPDRLILIHAYLKVWTERSIAGQLRQTPKVWVADQGRTGKCLASASGLSRPGANVIWVSCIISFCHLKSNCHKCLFRMSMLIF